MARPRCTDSRCPCSRSGGMQLIRIKVYKASHLMLGAALVVLAIILAVLVIRFAVIGNGAPVSGTQPRDSLVMAEQNEEAVAVFAAAPLLSGDGEEEKDRVVREVVFDDPASDAGEPGLFSEFNENEHTDTQDTEFIVEVLPHKSGEPIVKPEAGEPVRIVIYHTHTHTHEAYEQVSEDLYEETEKWRTTDPEHSVVKVGEALAELLRGYGFYVVHDTTDHEPPKLSTAYARSLKTVKKYEKEGFDVFIDLHRDAYGESTHRGIRTVSAGGGETGQLMMLIGNGEGFEEKPDFQQNYRFAQAITDRINALSPSLCRDVMVKNGRYNQNVSGLAVLVEAGHHLNTLPEVMKSVPYLAEALRDVLMGNEQYGIPAMRIK